MSLQGIPLRRAALTAVLGIGSLAGATAAAPELAAAQSDCALPAGASMGVLRYVDSFTPGSPVCNPGDLAQPCRLRGWLYTPSGPGPFAAIVLNHSNGHTGDESMYCEITERYVADQYVVFQPLRRGYSAADGIGQNTGELPELTLFLLASNAPSRSPVAASILSTCDHDGVPGLGASEFDCAHLVLLESQVYELRAAIAAVAALPMVDPSRIAIFGAGTGADLVALGADRREPPADHSVPAQAGVLLAPMELSYSNEHTIRERLKLAVTRRGFPLAFLAPRNGDDKDVIEDLAHSAVQGVKRDGDVPACTGEQDACDYQFMATLLKPVADATSVEAQRRFVREAAHVADWAEIARRFISLYPHEPVADPPRGQNLDPRTTCSRLSNDTHVTMRRYYEDSGVPGDPLCDEPDGTLCAQRGILYMPDGAKNAPAVVIHNGGGGLQSGESFCTLIEFFNHYGFVVFVPKRRGVEQIEEDDPDGRFHFKNRGVHFTTVIDRTRAYLEEGGALPSRAQPYSQDCGLEEDPRPPTAQALKCLNTKLTYDEIRESGEAVKWLRARISGDGHTPMVHPDQVAMIGHSGGGQLALHSAAALEGVRRPNVAIAVSPREKGWTDEGTKTDQLKDSVRDATVPIAIYRASNSPNVHSTRVLGKIAANRHKRVLTQIIPPVDIPPDKDPIWVHSGVVNQLVPIQQWGESARAFMAAYGIK